MKRNGIERQTLLITLIPILVMAVLLESYFIFTHFSGLDRSLLERAQLLTRQLAASSEYPMFSGNDILLKQNADSAAIHQDVEVVSIMDEQGSLVLESGNGSAKAYWSELAQEYIYQSQDLLGLKVDIMPTQINLDNLADDSVSNRKLGTVMIVFSKKGLIEQKQEFLIVSLLFTILAVTVALILALRTARSITDPVMKMYQAVMRIGGGDLEVILPPPGNIHELQELSKGIGEMAQHLRYDRDLLENRIEETTDGLRVKNKEVVQIHQEKEVLNENLEEALRDLQAIMEANPDLLYVFNKKGELIQWNSSFEKFFGLSREKLLHRKFAEFISPENKDEVERWVSGVFEKDYDAFEIQLLRHDGAVIPYMCNGVVLRNKHGEASGFTGTARDISERMAAAEHMHHLAHYDVLTDLPNRSMLSDRLHYAMITSKRENRNLAVLFLDLDMFKYVNDALGHDFGDLLLKQAAIRITDCLRESDTAARLGGDEFVVVLPLIESTEVALLVAEKIRHALSLPYEIEGHTMLVSSSIGISIYPEHGADEKSLLKNADTAMYLAKKKGRNAVVLYSR